MISYFKNLFDRSELKKVREAKEKSRIICDFLEFLKAHDLKFYTPVLLDGETETKLMEITASKEQIDYWLIDFFKIDLEKLAVEQEKQKQIEQGENYGKA
jgi:hypothetical protein